MSQVTDTSTYSRSKLNIILIFKHLYYKSIQNQKFLIDIMNSGFTEDRRRNFLSYQGEKRRHSRG